MNKVRVYLWELFDFERSQSHKKNLPQKYIQILFNSLIHLSQVYQVVFVMIKSANSPRPSAWILERSIDGELYRPWQYFGVNELDCQNRYSLPAHNGKYVFQTDSEVICSTQYSKTVPLENGEVSIYDK